MGYQKQQSCYWQNHWFDARKLRSGLFAMNLKG